jgi:hypothetical protein
MTVKSISRLQQALIDLEDRIVMASDRSLEDREYGISEIRYYRNLVSTFLEYPQDLQLEISLNLAAMIEEVELWLNESE